jgi:hypothetical protein
MKSVLLFGRSLSSSNLYLKKLLTFLLPQFNLPVNKNPKSRHSESQNDNPSDPRQVLQSKSLESEEIVVYIHCKPWLFYGSITPVLLVVVLEWFSDFWVHDVVLGESVSIIFDIKSGSEYTWSVCGTSSVLAAVDSRFSGESTLVSPEFINVEFLSDESVTKKIKHKILRFVSPFSKVAFWGRFNFLSILIQVSHTSGSQKRIVSIPGLTVT